MPSALLIYNPRAGRWAKRDRVAGLVAPLERAGWEIETAPTKGPGDATELAREVARRRDAVFAFGGDGTLREVAEGLLGSETALGPIPGGTANVVARAIGIPTRPADAVRALAGGRRIEIDVGLAGDRPFLMQVSAGLDARVMARQGSRLKRWLGRAAIAPAAFTEWWRYGYPTIEATLDGRAIRGSFLAVCNLALYGGGLRLAPAARPDDRRLDAVLFHGTGRAATLGFARDLLLGRHARRRDVELSRVDRAEFLRPPALAFQLDGDTLALAPPVEVRLAKQRLAVLVP